MFVVWSKQAVAWLEALAPEVRIRGSIASAIEQSVLAPDLRRKAVGCVKWPAMIRQLTPIPLRNAVQRSLG